jgi:hypothetical protein
MLGHLEIIENLDKKFSSAATYNRILVVNERGEYETLLLTEADLSLFRSRSRRNPEDLKLPDWKVKVLRFFCMF